ncbi:MAG: toll/interleukin-1 receptor domain-containing protein [Acidobacteriota bacterium]
MAEHGFPKSVEDVVATLAKIYRHQRQLDIVELLESASGRIEQTGYDNWDGGTYTYGLMLDVPVEVFASVEPRLEEIEKTIASTLAIICRDLSNDHLESVIVTPLSSKSATTGPRAKPAEIEVKHLWVESYFRLFLSHVSAHKASVSNLKSELGLRGISAFIAHEDIKPSLEWQNEIDLALRSMDALVALLTPDFHLSNWTDQEVGFALGQRTLVVPVRLGLDPYGFIGKVQGVSGSLENPSRLADLIVTTLLDRVPTRRNMRKGLAFAFAAARSNSSAISLSKEISTIDDFTEEETAVIERACKENEHVLSAAGVVSQVRAAIGVHELSRSFGDVDDIPF